MLELGCGNGSNLIPMAFCLPHSRFAGVDLAATQIEAGATRAASLGLKNLDLRHFDVMEIGRDFGEFDYIIAHGLYSWVPATVREKVFEVCRENLAPGGVAYVSYNTFPGGHLRRIVRDILRYHTRDIQDPKERVREALALARYLSHWRHDKDNERDLLRAEFDRVLGYDPNHLYHDDLAEINVPVYFREFAEQASRHGLKYLCEADFFEMQGPPVAPEGPDAPRLPAPDDLIEFEQYIDFLRCRRFRQTLLCHDGVTIDRSLEPSRLKGLFLASPLKPESETPDLSYGKIEQFSGPHEVQIGTDFPAAKAALVVLGKIYPLSLRFEALLKRSRELAAAGSVNGDDWPEQIARELAGMLLKMYATNAVELSASPPRFTVEVSERPEASRLVREQLKAGQVVVNQLHRLVEIRDDKARQLLQLADGTRDLATLRREMVALAQTEISTDAMVKNLHSAARGALLVR